MITLHALWDSIDKGSLLLWGEEAAFFEAAVKSKKALSLHPYALTTARLKEALGELCGSLLVECGEPKIIKLRLPTGGKHPLPSPELRLPNRVEETPQKLGEWQVPALTFTPSSALDLLVGLPDNPPLWLGTGASLIFWEEAAKLALVILAGQHFVPSLEERQAGKGSSYRAIWEPHLEEELEKQLQILAKAMPPVCQALTGATCSPTLLLKDFLRRTVDTLVRQTLQDSRLLPATRGKPSLYRQWLNGLASPVSANLDASPSELKQFAKTVTGWLEQLKPDPAAFRTCFRLDPPPETSSNPIWSLNFHLQANDDRSLLVPAEQVWKTRGSALTFLKRRFENPQERLLADLGKASRLFPPLDRSMTTARPVELTLDTAGAYEFLRQGAPLLEQSGFGVFLPPWWQKAKAKVAVKMKLKDSGKTTSGLLGLDGIVAYDWQAAVGDQTLSLEEFARLAQMKVPLVQVRGQWVELRPEDIEAAIAFFEKQQRGELSLGEALRWGLGQEGDTFRVVEVAGEGWIGELLQKLNGKAQIKAIKQPVSFKGQLRPYQLKGVAWLAFLRQYGLGGILADDMGLGKSAQLISLLLYEREHNKKGNTPGTTLLVCPMSIVGNWQRELSRFAPSLKVMVHYGSERLSGEDFKTEALQHDLVISTYSLVHRDTETLTAVEWERVALDEAQNIKNSASKQSLAIRKLTARYRVALTGTPVENRLSELWSIMDFLNPGYLGSATEFRNRYSLSIEKFRDRDKAETLKKLIQPFVLRRVKTDKSIISDLPDKLEMKVFCNLTREQATLYEAVVKDMLEQIEQAEEGIQRKGLVLSTLMKLKQVCNHPAHFAQDGSPLPGRSGKLARLEEMLEEVLAEGDRALVFTQFSEFGGLLRGYLQETLGCEILFLHGGSTKKQRDEMVQRFQEDKHAPPIFLLSLKAGGVGLNLTAANHVFHFDRWWNPAVENQATDRAFRIGQQKNVQVHKFVCAGTLEERIDMMIEQKKELADSIVNSGEGWITEFSTMQLRELFALSREAIGE
ncbi:MAG: DEAD/DEAH box helicase [Chloroflexi bacterium]|uniref:DEAD/DEAH box helicase n=1 Tax=Candidatus Chlorohelix allophototropha TaxID=3003348 RepID=A0A8T7M644_9CHLR|nr:DEAD/DEAH box helicase [Chloroflexota bacterium]WJW69488.1 DEAD/DEAH box helicase [Chloroflexota bacterium L227-S17]